MKQSDHHHHHHPIPSAILDKGEQSNIYISGSWQQLFQCQQNCQYHHDHQKHCHHRPHNHHKKRWKAILFKQIIRLIMWKCTALCRESISKIVSARAFHFKHFPGHFQNVSFQTFFKMFQRVPNPFRHIVHPHLQLQLGCRACVIADLRHRSFRRYGTFLGWSMSRDFHSVMRA